MGPGSRGTWAWADEAAARKAARTSGQPARRGGVQGMDALPDMRRWPAEVEGRGGPFPPVIFQRLKRSFKVANWVVGRIESSLACDFQVIANYADSVREVLMASSDGRLSFDRQPMARMGVAALAREVDGVPQQGYSGGGGRVTLRIRFLVSFIHPLCPW